MGMEAPGVIEMPAGRRTKAGRSPSLLLPLAAIAAAWIACAPPAWAGFAVRVEYVDPHGTRVTVDGDDATYAFHRRLQYRKKAEEKAIPYRDEKVTRTTFPFASRSISFGAIRTLTLDRRATDEGETLILVFETVTGERIEMPGSELEGSEHPIPPALEFRSQAGPLSIPIDPLASAARRQGRPELVRVSFPRNPDLRRPSRR